MGRRHKSTWDPHAQAGDPQTGGLPQLQRSSRRSERSEHHTVLCSLGILHQEDEAPQHLAWKPAGFTFGRAAAILETETLLLKENHKLIS